MARNPNQEDKVSNIVSLTFRIKKREEIKVVVSGVPGMGYMKKGKACFEHYFVRWPNFSDAMLPQYLRNPPTPEIRYTDCRPIFGFYRIVSSGRGKNRKWFIEILEEVTARKRTQV